MKSAMKAAPSPTDHHPRRVRGRPQRRRQKKECGLLNLFSVLVAKQCRFNLKQIFREELQVNLGRFDISIHT